MLLNLRSGIPLLLPGVDGPDMRTFNKTIPAGLGAAALVVLHEMSVGEIIIKTEAEVYGKLKA